MENWWENWFSNMDMKGSDNSFNQKHPTIIGHCSNSVPNAATHGKNKRVRSSWEIQGHIMSERKRRQETAERFIALSAMIPGLKKIDKVSVLGEAINYVKQLKERISMLEQQCYERNKKSSKSIISIKKFQSHPRNDNLDSNHVLLPEVEAIGIESEKELVLIKINCEKHEGILFKLLSMLENMHLYVSTSSVLPFGKNTLNITIIAKMGEEYRITIEELMTKLKQDVLKLYDM